MADTKETGAVPPITEPKLAEGLPPTDEEKQTQDADTQALVEKKVSAFKSLGWLDRFLAVWILLAMVIGILLGNFVPNVTESLEKGKFVNVSVPIGKLHGVQSIGSRC